MIDPSPRPHDVLSLGNMYLDIDLLNFPFIDALAVHKETVGDHYQLEPGGSALNFARMCAAQGLQTVFVGKRGQDTLGELLTGLLHQTGVTPHLITDTAVQTNLAIHYLRDDGASIMTSAGTANQSLEGDEVLAMVRPIIPAVKYLYLGGCYKLKKLLPIYSQLIELAHAYQVQVIVDHGRPNNTVTAQDKAAVKNLVAQADLYLPSKDEFLDLWEADTIEAGLEIVRQATPALVVVKNSEAGAVTLVDHQVMRVPAFPVKAINTVGAGDSFNAGFIASWEETRDIHEAMRYGCAMAALKISTEALPSKVAVEAFELQ